MKGISRVLNDMASIGAMRAAVKSRRLCVSVSRASIVVEWCESVEDHLEIRDCLCKRGGVEREINGRSVQCGANACIQTQVALYRRDNATGGPNDLVLCERSVIKATV